MSKKGDYLIPFNSGSMMEYSQVGPGVVAVNGHPYNAPTEWRENKPFEATVRLTGTWRGRTAARVGVDNTENEDSYSMGLAAFYEAVVAYGVQPGGLMKGTWAFRKQGANYGLVAWVDK